MGHLLGYARVSTDDQQPHLQVDALKQAGRLLRVVAETASGAATAVPPSTRSWISCGRRHPGRLEAGPAGPAWNGSIGDVTQYLLALR
jgi:hypothetical protein